MEAIKLNEKQLKNIIKESVIKILKENDRLGWSDEVWNTYKELKEVLGPEKLCDEIAGKLNVETLESILNTIKELYDIGYNDEEEI